MFTIDLKIPSLVKPLSYSMAIGLMHWYDLYLISAHVPPNSRLTVSISVTKGIVSGALVLYVNPGKVDTSMTGWRICQIP